VDFVTQCVLWWRERFERLLAALKSNQYKKHRVATVLAQASDIDTGDFGGAESSFESYLQLLSFSLLDVYQDAF